MDCPNDGSKRKDTADSCPSSPSPLHFTPFVCHPQRKPLPLVLLLWLISEGQPLDLDWTFEQNAVADDESNLAWFMLHGIAFVLFSRQFGGAKVERVPNDEAGEWNNKQGDKEEEHERMCSSGHAAECCPKYISISPSSKSLQQQIGAYFIGAQ